MLATIRHYEGTGYWLHAFVIMPDHLHLLLTPAESLEKCVQLIKGGFSFRAKRELQWNGAIWQTGFTDHRIRDVEDWRRHLDYIRSNPIEARLVEDAVLYEFMGFPNIAFPRGLKPPVSGGQVVRAKARTLRPGSPLASRGISDDQESAALANDASAQTSTLQQESPLATGGAAEAASFQDNYQGQKFAVLARDGVRAKSRTYQVRPAGLRQGSEENKHNATQK